MRSFKGLALMLFGALLFPSVVLAGTPMTINYEGLAQDVVDGTGPNGGTIVLEFTGTVPTLGTADLYLGTYKFSEVDDATNDIEWTVDAVEGEITVTVPPIGVTGASGSSKLVFITNDAPLLSTNHISNELDYKYWDDMSISNHDYCKAAGQVIVMNGLNFPPQRPGRTYSVRFIDHPTTPTIDVTAPDEDITLNSTTQLTIMPPAAPGDPKTLPPVILMLKVTTTTNNSPDDEVEVFNITYWFKWAPAGVDDPITFTDITWNHPDDGPVNYGPTAGDNTADCVTITGTNFIDGWTYVSFDNGVSYVVPDGAVTSTEIKTTLPAGTGTQTVKVINAYDTTPYDANPTSVLLEFAAYNATQSFEYKTDIFDPTISWATDPSSGVLSGTVTLSAFASDDGSVASVKFYYSDITSSPNFPSDYTLIDTDTTEPYTASWNTVAYAIGLSIGENVSVVAMATDASAGTTVTDPVLTVAIDNSGAVNVQPAATFVRPVTAATISLDNVSAASPYSLVAECIDTDTGISNASQVTFWLDGVQLAGTVSAITANDTFSLNWDGTHNGSGGDAVTAGSHMLTVVVADDDGLENSTSIFFTTTTSSATATINSITPTQCNLRGGDPTTFGQLTVTIKGSGFGLSGTPTVNFGIVAASSVSRDSDTQLTVIIPDLAGQYSSQSYVPITVTPEGSTAVIESKLLLAIDAPAQISLLTPTASSTLTGDISLRAELLDDNLSPVIEYEVSNNISFIDDGGVGVNTADDVGSGAATWPYQYDWDSLALYPTQPTTPPETYVRAKVTYDGGVSFVESAPVLIFLDSAAAADTTPVINVTASTGIYAGAASITVSISDESFDDFTTPASANTKLPNTLTLEIKNSFGVVVDTVNLLTAVTDPTVPSALNEPWVFAYNHPLDSTAIYQIGQTFTLEVTGTDVTGSEVSYGSGSFTMIPRPSSTDESGCFNSISAGSRDKNFSSWILVLTSIALALNAFKRKVWKQQLSR